MPRRLYEGMFLFDANDTARRWSELEDKVKQIMAKNGAEIRYSERWPDQRLAYEINGCRKGTYFLTYFDAETDNVQPMRRDCELTEDILRVMIVQEEDLEQDMERRRDLAARRSAEAASRPAPAPVAEEAPKPEAPKAEASEGASEDDSDFDEESAD